MNFKISCRTLKAHKQERTHTLHTKAPPTSTAYPLPSIQHILLYFKRCITSNVTSSCNSCTCKCIFQRCWTPGNHDKLNSCWQYFVEIAPSSLGPQEDQAILVEMLLTRSEHVNFCLERESNVTEILKCYHGTIHVPKEIHLLHTMETA